VAWCCARALRGIVLFVGWGFFACSSLESSFFPLHVAMTAQKNGRRTDGIATRLSAAAESSSLSIVVQQRRAKIALVCLLGCLATVGPVAATVVPNRLAS